MVAFQRMGEPRSLKKEIIYYPEEMTSKREAFRRPHFGAGWPFYFSSHMVASTITHVCKELAGAVSIP